jgi:hypothetical protein
VINLISAVVILWSTDVPAWNWGAARVPWNGSESKVVRTSIIGRPRPPQRRGEPASSASAMRSSSLIVIRLAARKIVLSSVLMLGLTSLGACTLETGSSENSNGDSSTPQVTAEATATGGGWGPDRELFTSAKPAGFPSMNSITDNPAFGDERNFFRVKLSEQGDENYASNVTLRPGADVIGYVYFGNSAAKNIVTGRAEDVRLSLAIPAVVDGAANANAIIESSNSSPPEVWSTVTFQSGGQGAFALRYVPNSAVLHTGGSLDGAHLDGKELLSDSGVILGCDQLDGLLSGEERCAGYVSFILRADQPNFSIAVSLRVSDSGDFGPRVAASPGDIVTIRLVYQNTGTTSQSAVSLGADAIPGTEVVGDSLKILDANHPAGTVIEGDSNSILDTVDIGDFTPGSNAIVVYKVRIARQGALECGGKWLIVRARAETANGSKSAPEGIIDVNGVC